MKREIRLGEKNNKVSYLIRKSGRAKRLRVSVHRDGGVVVTIPKRVNERIVEKFLIEKEDWLLSKINFFNQIKSSYIPKSSKADYLENKEKASLIISERVESLNQNYGFSFNKIFIKNQKTLWGSCSRKRNLNFNYRIIFLPDNLRDYIIVHELCHLGEFNHSRKFWDLVAITFSDFKKLRQELRMRGFL